MGQLVLLDFKPSRAQSRRASQHNRLPLPRPRLLLLLCLDGTSATGAADATALCRSGCCRRLSTAVHPSPPLGDLHTHWPILALAPVCCCCRRWLGRHRPARLEPRPQVDRQQASAGCLACCCCCCCCCCTCWLPPGRSCCIGSQSRASKQSYDRASLVGHVVWQCLHPQQHQHVNNSDQEEPKQQHCSSRPTFTPPASQAGGAGSACRRRSSCRRNSLTFLSATWAPAANTVVAASSPGGAHSVACE